MTGLFDGQQVGKETQVANLKERIRAKTENIEIVLDGHRKDSVREEIRAPTSTKKTTKKKGTRRRSRSTSETRRTSKGDGKGDTEGK